MCDTPRAAIVYLVEPSRVDGMYGKKAPIRPPGTLTRCSRQESCLLNSMTTLLTNNKRYIAKYPLVILHEDTLPKHYRTVIQTHATKIAAQIVMKQVRLDNVQGNLTSLNLCARMMEKHRFFNTTSTRAGYFSMCAFFAWEVMHALRQYDYIMRIDTDSCVGKFGRDPFAFAHRHSYRYMYRSLFVENLRCMDHFNALVGSYSNKWNKDRVSQWTRGKRMKVFDNNFELLHLPTFRNSNITKFLRGVREAGGVRQYRWGDAMVRMYTVLLHIDDRQVYRFSSWHYDHKGRKRPIRPNAIGISNPIPEVGSVDLCD